MTATLIRRAYRYRLYPTPEQEAVLGQWSGVCRLVYNLAWEQRRDFHRQYRRATGRALTYFSQSAEIKPLRAEYDWIAAAPQEALTYALRDLDRAFVNFFAGRARYPKPRRRSDGHGFRVRGSGVAVRALNAKWAVARIPKLGEVHFRSTRPIVGTVRNVSLGAVAGQWFVTFAADHAVEAAAPSAAAVGLDRGVTSSACLSNGEHYHAPQPSAATARAQRKLSRKVRRSGRYGAQLAKVTRLRTRDGRRRSDWSHKVSTGLATRFGFVVAERLNIKGMTASAVGSVDEPGAGVAQKRGLNRAILAQGWGRLTQHLAYKLQDRGGALVMVDPKFTSQTCASCGAIDARSRESQAVFRCVHCGHEDNADVNAAKEILRRGAPWLDVEADAGRPSKRQSHEAQHV